MSSSFRPYMNSRICKPLPGPRSSETISVVIVLDDTSYTRRYDMTKDDDMFIEALSRKGLSQSQFLLHFLKPVSIQSTQRTRRIKQLCDTVSEIQNYNVGRMFCHAVRFNGCIVLSIPRLICVHLIFALERTCLPPRTI